MNTTSAPQDVAHASLIDLGGVSLTDLLRQDDSVLMDVLRRLTGGQDDVPAVSAFTSAM